MALLGFELGPLDVVAAGGGCFDGAADAIVSGSPSMVINGMMSTAMGMASGLAIAYQTYQTEMDACKHL